MRRSDDAPTIAALGLLAYLAADLAHHVLGHAMACRAVGGAVLSIAATAVSCSKTGAIIDLAGPAASLLTGLMAWMAARAFQSRPTARLFLILVAAFNLFWFEGQLAYSAAFGTDDWNQLIIGLGGALALKAGLVAVGLVAYGATVKGLETALGDFATPPAGRVWRIAVIAYTAAVVTALITAATDPGGPAAMLTRAAPQALLPIGILLLRPSPSPSPKPLVDRRPVLIAVALIALAASVLFLGPGLHPHAPGG